MKAKLECKDCMKRYPACHDHCESYMAWKAEYEAVKQKRKEYIDTERTLKEGRYRCSPKIRKYSERRRNHKDL